MLYKVTVSAKVVQGFFCLIRATLAVKKHCKEPFHVAIECGENTFRGHRKGKRGWEAAGEIIVPGILQRDSMVRDFPGQKSKGREVNRHPKVHTRAGSPYYTDNWHVCRSLAVRGDHNAVKKGPRRLKGRPNINGIKDFRSYASISSICNAEYLERFFIFICEIIHSASTIATKTFSHHLHVYQQHQLSRNSITFVPI
jgi:transposase